MLIFVDRQMPHMIESSSCLCLYRASLLTLWYEETEKRYYYKGIVMNRHVEELHLLATSLREQWKAVLSAPVWFLYRPMVRFTVAVAEDRR